MRIAQTHAAVSRVDVDDCVCSDEDCGGRDTHHHSIPAPPSARTNRGQVSAASDRTLAPKSARARSSFASVNTPARSKAVVQPAVKSATNAPATSRPGRSARSRAMCRAIQPAPSSFRRSSISRVHRIDAGTRQHTATGHIAESMAMPSNASRRSDTPPAPPTATAASYSGVPGGHADHHT